MQSKAGSLLVLVVALFLFLAEARIALGQRWLPFPSITSSEDDSEQRIYAAAEARVKRQESSPVQTAPCAPADAPPELPRATAVGDPACLPFPSPEELTGQLAPGSSPEPNVKRSNGLLRGLLNGLDRSLIVPTNEGGVTYFQEVRGTVDMSTGLGTSDLCGCTVALVTSPYAMIMIHVLEQRAEGELWWREPDGEQQQEADVRWATKGGQLLDGLLKKLQAPADRPGQIPTVENDWNGWFPSTKTTINIIAPMWNREYYGTGWQYAEQSLIQNVMDGGWVYPRQPDLLIDTIKARVNADGTARSQKWGYRRRYTGDPQHGNDDRDIVVALPFASNQETISGNQETISAWMYFDDDKSQEIMRLA